MHLITAINIHEKLNHQIVEAQAHRARLMTRAMVATWLGVFAAFTRGFGTLEFLLPNWAVQPACGGILVVSLLMLVFYWIRDSSFERTTLRNAIMEKEVFEKRLPQIWSNPKAWQYDLLARDRPLRTAHFLFMLLTLLVLGGAALFID